MEKHATIRLAADYNNDGYILRRRDRRRGGKVKLSLFPGL